MEIIDNINNEIVKENSKENEYVENRCTMNTCGISKMPIMPQYSCNEGNLKIGDMAPFFEGETTLGYCRLTDFKGKWLCLFSHPADFTPVCSTEFMAFAKMEPEFKRRNCCLLGLSIDSLSSHLAWIHNLNKISGCPINFPLIADPSMSIAKKYGMIAPNSSTTKTIRCVYLICPEQKIKAILHYPSTTGRNITEILRLLDALQFTDNEKLYTPANWCPGMPALLPPPMCYQELTERLQNPCDMTCYDFYLCYKQPQNIGIPNTCNQCNPNPCPMPNVMNNPMIKHQHMQMMGVSETNNCGLNC